VRIVLSRKGFDGTSGGCPSPIFPDGSMLSLPIPDRTSPVRYRDLEWRGRNVGELVERLTGGRRRASDGAHLDPDLRAGARPRLRGWRPTLGQIAAAQGHLRNRGVGAGDLFLFFGLFRAVDLALRWTGPPVHVVWGWLQVAAVASVDRSVRPLAGSRWRWAADHPHLAFRPEPSNTLYVAADRLTIPGCVPATPGAGAFDVFAPRRRLTAPAARTASRWSLPRFLLPSGRRALTYHGDPARWSASGDAVLLVAASRGQEFVLDTSEYPDAVAWAAALLRVESAPHDALPRDPLLAPAPRGRVRQRRRPAVPLPFDDG
jgi:hypothetical protein